MLGQIPIATTLPYNMMHFCLYLSECSFALHIHSAENVL